MSAAGKARTLAKWMGMALLTPILLFLILSLLLYCPPVQNWAVDQVARIASEKLGMTVSVGHVSLEWPLNLGIDDFLVVAPHHPLSTTPSDSSAVPSPAATTQQHSSALHPLDTLADIGHLSVDVRLRPLFRQRVVINQLSMERAKVNTNGFISDVCVKGRVGELWLRSKGIGLDSSMAEVNGARLVDAHLDIALSDTAAVDTTTSAVLWRISADSIGIYRSSLALHLPGDTLHVAAFMGSAVAREADIDLATSTYRVASFDWRDGRLSYDEGRPLGVLAADTVSGSLDYGHIALRDIRLGIDSIYYGPLGSSLYIRETAMRERCGLEISELTGGVKLDTAFNHIELPQLTLRTPDSDVFAEVSADFNVADTLNPGKMHLRVNAQVGKQDLMRLTTPFLQTATSGSQAPATTLLPSAFWRQYPNHPLTVKGAVSGNLQRMAFTGLDISLPTALHLSVDGFAANVADMNQLRAQVNVRAESRNLSFVTTLMPAFSLALPPMRLSGDLRAEGRQYAADLLLTEGSGAVKARGSFNTVTQAYDLDATVRHLDLHHFLPKDSLGLLSLTATAHGRGTDVLHAGSTMQADATLHALSYGSWNIDSVMVTATLANGHGTARVSGHNELVDGAVDVDALLSAKRVEATVTADVAKADCYRLRLLDEPLAVGMNGQVTLSSDLDKTHQLRALFSSIAISDARRTYHPEDLGLFLRTDVDTTIVRAQSGNLIVKFDGSGGYEQVISKYTALADSVAGQIDQRVIDQPAIKRLLPVGHLYVSSGRDNPVANILRTRHVDFRELLVDLTTSPVTGINGQAHIFSLNYDSTRIDTVRLRLVQKDDRLTYNGQVRNNRRNPQFVFNALFDGHLHQHGCLVGLRYFDDRGRMGIRLGATAEMETDGLRIRFLPERPTIGYKAFNLNKDNFLFFGNDKRILADIDLVADDKTGLKVYSTENLMAQDLVAEQPDSSSPADDSPQVVTPPLDLTVSLNRFNLDEFTSVLPYVPRMTGLLGGDFHIVQDQTGHLSVASDMGVRQFTYEGSPVGDLSTEFTYLQQEGNAHAVEARLMLSDEEFGLFSGTLKPQDGGDGTLTALDAVLTLTRAPLSIVNGFVPDQLIGLDGYAEGSVTVKGTTEKPVVDGELLLDSAYLVSQPYGMRMSFDNDTVRIVGSHLLLENFGLYAYNDEPLNMMGDIDFSNSDRITMDLRMRASNFQLINAQQTAKSLAFGKAFVNFFARIRGPLDALSMRGRLTVLGSTDMTYMLLDSPLSTDNRLDELVKFTDFSDTTQTVVTRPTPTGLNMDMTVSVSQGVHVVCCLNAEQTNYVDLMGGGDLRMSYGSDGLSLTGRYTLSNGEMKYSLPIIPLKTFTISDGSYVEFFGDPMNPRLNITATERTKAVVGGGDGGQSRSVAFDCGVVITKTLNDMGLQFIISAPEDFAINSELQSMSEEERGKLAVTMLTTGMYLADGNTNGFSMNSALSSFLQGEINNITGTALKTLDLQVGVDNTTDATGQMHTDYSFKFAKRFMNNRLKIQLGGKVSTGANDMPGQQQSFFDNVTMEYRLNQEGTQNVKLFYNQNVYDWLEGYTGEYGGGFIWRRKLDSFWDIFKLKTSTLQMPAYNFQRPDTVRAGRRRGDSADTLLTGSRQSESHRTDSLTDGSQPADSLSSDRLNPSKTR